MIIFLQPDVSDGIYGHQLETYINASCSMMTNLQFNIIIIHDALRNGLIALHLATSSSLRLCTIPKTHKSLESFLNQFLEVLYRTDRDALVFLFQLFAEFFLHKLESFSIPVRPHALFHVKVKIEV